MTIQTISTFWRKVPDKHKEKMWQKHCMGKYVKIDKVGSLLYDIARLCIKIHDRNVKPLDLENDELVKKLEPYTKLLESQIREKDDPTGLTQDDLNDSLHEWLLLPLPLAKYGETLKSILDENSKLKQRVELYKQFIY